MTATGTVALKALSYPARQIAFNAGADGSIVVGKILEKDQYNYGYDAQTNEEGPGLVYTLTNAPTGATINSTTGVVTWMPVRM